MLIEPALDPGPLWMFSARDTHCLEKSLGQGQFEHRITGWVTHGALALTRYVIVPPLRRLSGSAFIRAYSGVRVEPLTDGTLRVILQVRLLQEEYP
jgi:hypothetical protein